MPLQSDPSKRLHKLFHRRKCWLLADLASALDYALISVRRLLKRIGYFRSFSDNGKWYTLRSLPEFNREGNWHHRGIGFSKSGNLTATITHLVGRSHTGLSAKELAQKLRHPCHSVLTHLHKHGELDRIKLQGEFRYLSKEQQTNRRQRESSALQQPREPSTSLSTQAAVLVLVEYIKEPGLSFEQMAQRLRERRGISVGAQSIHDFFDQHGLKKTSDTLNSDH